MSGMSPVHVAGVGLFSPGFRSLSSWLDARGRAALEGPPAESALSGGSSVEPAAASAVDAPIDASLLSARMRGRASRLTRIFASVVEQAVKQAQTDVGHLPMIYGSAFGEMTTTLRLLESMQGGDGRVSPAQFQASVHNTAAGQISISQGNRAFTTSIAAGRDTFAMCLLEAWSWLELHGGQVLIACADDAIPSIFEPAEAFSPLGVAFVLDTSGRHRTAIARLGRPEARSSGLPSAEAFHIRVPRVVAPPSLLDNRAAAPDRQGSNPCEPGLALLTALFDVNPCRLLLNPSSEPSWQIEVYPLGSPGSERSNGAVSSSDISSSSVARARS